MSHVCEICARPMESTDTYMCRRFKSKEIRPEMEGPFHYAHLVCTPCKKALGLPLGGAFAYDIEGPCPDVDIDESTRALAALAVQA